MKTHNLIQGSPEWLAYRAQHFNASDAPAMMGCSPYKTRAQLLRELHTGLTPEVDAGTQRRFNDGHRFEALARPLAEQIIGEDLYPVTGSNGRLSASFDGLTMGEDVAFEHKTLNEELRAAFAAIADNAPDDCGWLRLPLPHRIQMEQQLMVSGAGAVLFMASAWTSDGSLDEERHCFYYSDKALRQQIIDGWAQFERDMAAYVPPVTVEPAPAGKTPDTLPALRIEVTGAVTASNLAEFKETALSAIRSVNRTLATDQDFADADKAVKWCADVEQRLAAAKEHALSQTASIDALFKTIDDISAEARRVRLDLDKLVTRRKTEVKEEAVATARKALDQHVAALNAEIAPMRLQPVAADFAGAIKGKRSVDSMQDALDTTLAAAKIAADTAARLIRANLAHFQAHAADLEFLFADLHQIANKAADDFQALVQARIATHKAAEAKKEADRQAAEAARIAAAEKRAREQAEAAAKAAAEAAARAADVKPPAPAMPERCAKCRNPERCDRVGCLDAAASAPAERNAPRPAPLGDGPATLKIGDINARLAPLKIDGAGLAELGIAPAKMYRESDFGRLLRGIAKHIEALQSVPA